MERFLTNFKQKGPVEPSNDGRKIKRQKYNGKKKKKLYSVLDHRALAPSEFSGFFCPLYLVTLNWCASDFSC
jgi:hypothetical protein